MSDTRSHICTIICYSCRLLRTVVVVVAAVLFCRIFSIFHQSNPWYTNVKCRTYTRIRCMYTVELCHNIFSENILRMSGCVWCWFVVNHYALLSSFVWDMASTMTLHKLTTTQKMSQQPGIRSFCMNLLFENCFVVDDTLRKSVAVWSIDVSFHKIQLSQNFTVNQSALHTHT